MSTQAITNERHLFSLIQQGDQQEFSRLPAPANPTTCRASPALTSRRRKFYYS